MSVSTSSGVARVSSKWFARAWWLLPLIFAGIYLVTLAVKFDHVIGSIYQNADAASGPVIGQLFGTAGSHVTLGNYAWYWSLLFELATRWIPGHRAIWEGVPYLLVLIGAGLSVRVVNRVAGKAAATLTAVILLCASPSVLQWEMSLNDHSPTWFCLAVLGWWLVVLERGKVAHKPWLLALGVCAIGAIVGPEAASDPLLVIAGVVPFAAAVAGARFFGEAAGRRHGVIPAIATLIAIAVGWLATGAVVSALHIVKADNSLTTFATGNQVSTNLFSLWWQCVVTLGNGSFFGQTLKLTSGVELVSAILALGSVLWLPRVGWLEINRRQAPAPASSSAIRFSLIVYWVTSAVLLSLAFVTSSAAVNITSTHYLVGLIYPVAVVIPIVCSGGSVSRAVAVVSVCVYALAGVLAMVQGQIFAQLTAPPTAGINGVVSYLEEHHLHTGYAEYWDAAPVTWASHMHVDAYPVESCSSTICPFYLHTISSWYKPSTTRTFVITDGSSESTLTSVPASLGTPTATYSSGGLTVSVFDYDVASKIPAG